MQFFGASAPKRAIKNTIQMDGVLYCHSCPKKNWSKNLIFFILVVITKIF